MTHENHLSVFHDEWLEFLRCRDHFIERDTSEPYLIQSRNGAGLRYLWYLTLSRKGIRVFNEAEIEDINHWARDAKQQKRQFFIVIYFRMPSSKVVITPAERVLSLRTIPSSIGGISWK